MNTKLSNITAPVLNLFSSLIMKVVNMSMSSTCFFLTYEPEMPEELQ